jgi:bacillithiol biosynthesis cysteine-adding enzyme BshC
MRTAYKFGELGVKPIALHLYEGTPAADKFFPPIRPLADCVKFQLSSFSGSQQCCRPNRRMMAEMLRSQQPMPDEPAVVQALEVAETDGFFLISGQQVGVCLGPLYTLIKAVALLALRDKLERELPGYRFVPLFWASGMDHDFEEIRHADFPSGGGAWQRVSIGQPPGTEGMPCSSIALSVEAVAQLGAMFDMLPSSAHVAKMRSAFAAAYTPGATLSEAFMRLMAHFLAKEGLLVFDPEDLAAKRLGVDLFKSSLSQQPAEWAALEARNKVITAAGGHEQVVTVEGDTNLFLLDENGVREKIVHAGNGFALKGSGASFSESELSELAERDPSRISFGALMRPLFQQSLFPTAAFIGGAGEVAYWAQLFPLFGVYGLPEPLLLPRPSFTLTTSRQRRLLEKYSLELTDFMQPQHEIVHMLASKAVPQELSARLDELEQSYASRESALVDEAVKLDPGLQGVLETLGANFRKHLATVRKKVEQSIKRGDDQLSVQAAELCAGLMPSGALQERSLNSLAALSIFGEGLIGRLRAACEFPPAAHMILPL